MSDVEYDYDGGAAEAEPKEKRSGAYRVEICPNNRAKCKGSVPCKGEKILKDTLRHSVLVEIQSNTSWAYRHWGCVTPAVMKKMKETIGEVEDLDGFDELPEVYQEKLRTAWEVGHVAEEDVPDTADKKKMIPGWVDPNAPEGSEEEKPKKKPRKRKAKDDDDEDEEEPAAKPKRGRKKKEDTEEADGDEPAAKPKRGRKKKVEADEDAGEKPAAKPKRGRKKKEDIAEDDAEEPAEEPAAKPKRGRKKKVDDDDEAPKKAPAKRRRVTKKKADDDEDAEDQE